jgi:hypothetical protein
MCPIPSIVADGVLFDKSQTTLIQCPWGTTGTYIIPNNVTNIGDNAFYHCTSLTNVTIPNSVTSIGQEAFCNCPSLVSVTIPDAVATIGDFAFAGCTSLTSVTIPDSVTSIGYEAFNYCTSLTNVTIGSGVTNIGACAFFQCNNLSSVYFKGNAPALIGGMLNDGGNATIYYLPETTGWGATFGGLPTVPIGYAYADNGDGTCTITGYTGDGGDVAIPGTISNLLVSSIGSNAFRNCTTLTSIMIPNSVANIGDGAFAVCTNLTSVTIPNSVANIGDEAFSYCTSMTNLAIGAGVPIIGQWAFAFCWNLTAITVDDLNPAYSSLDGVLFDKTTNTLIVCPAGKAGTYAIPENVTNIVSTAFSSCARLTSVTIPNTVTDIGDYAFGGCTLTNAIVLNGVTRLGVGAFYNCQQLPSVNIGGGITSIGHDTFFWCRSLTSVTLPNSVTNIGVSAFLLCTALTSVTIPNGVTSIGRVAFSQCSSLSRLTIPSSVTCIGNYAFDYCTSLTSVYFKGNAPNLGGSAVFSGSPTTVYYLPSTTGWDTFGYSQIVLWNPEVLSVSGNFGVGTNGFGFTFTNAGSPTIVVQACTNLVSPDWLDVGTNTLTSGSSYFSDPGWTNDPARFYRFRVP